MGLFGDIGASRSLSRVLGERHGHLRLEPTPTLQVRGPADGFDRDKKWCYPKLSDLIRGNDGIQQ